ncbi:MAG: molybdopterin-guanine dinucleotide biosynthesis protein B [Gammaproteobacteria bacterium]|nr:molybdopterin-guanine dinucleotide biosynthesis protein B [Gammaproteobacteria bacterium]MCP5137463.1 molybdopterin-guanine dinucleotide biosynthesis protein B [Gammaproteobacteria bacterium]
MNAPVVSFPLPLLGIAAASGTGKTTLLERLIPSLRQRGLRIALVKHSHHDFDIDKPGKDSDRLRKAGALQVVLASQFRKAVIIETPNRDDEPDLVEALAHLDRGALDLVLVEGYRSEPFPKLELHRPVRERPLLCLQDPYIIAVAHDAPTPLDIELPQLDLNDAQAIADWIMAGLENGPLRTPQTLY